MLKVIFFTYILFSLAWAQSVIIVDANNSAFALATSFRQQGYKVIHMRSIDSFVFAATKKQMNKLFEQDFSFDQLSHQELQKIIKEQDVKFSIGGSERGVIVADEIAYRFDLPSNDYSLLPARRNKFLMQQQLKKSGVRYIPHELVHTPEQAMAWATQLQQWPVVVKPLDLASAKGLTFCNEVNCVKKAVENIFRLKDYNGELVKEAIVQKYIQGTEFAVNVVTHDVHTVFTDIWRYEKVAIEGSGILYENLILQNYEGEIQKALREYALEVIDALGVRIGATHMEIMMTESGPVLIEVGARTPGSGVPLYAKNALKVNQPEMMALAYTQPEKFHQITNGYRKQREVQIYAINNFKKDSYINPDAYKIIKSLKTKKDIRVNEARLFQKAHKITRNNTSAVMRVVLSGSKKDVARDLKIIKQLEKSSLFLDSPCNHTFK
jgi:phosphoribosylamine-glycine ligase